MIGYTVKSSIKHNGKRYKKGDFIDNEKLDEQSAKRLLFLGVVEKSFKADSDEHLLNNEGNNDPDNGGKLPDRDEETIEETIKLNFERAELIDAANKFELDFKGNISNASLINLLVSNGHAQYFLDQLED